MPKTQINTSRTDNGVNLYYINDGKYKTNYTNIYFSMPLNSHNATSANLVARILKRGCKAYPTMSELNQALDMNYSTGISLSSSKEGEKQVFLLSVSTMKNRYAPNAEDIFAQAMEIAFEVLFNPISENDAFDAEYFESEKRNLRDSIMSQINNKGAYSRTRFIKMMCDAEPYSTNGEGDIEVLDKLTNKEVYSFFKNMLSNAVCDVYFVGSESEDRVKDIVGKHFSGIKRTPTERIKTGVVTDVRESRSFTEELDIAQAHLWIGYRTPATYSSPDYLKFVLFNMVMGGDVSSKMFMNIREKLSLCYTCYSSFDGMKGIFTAYAGIDPENKEKTLDAFYAELEKIRDGQITPTELEDAKKAYINRMMEIQDNPSLLPAWFHMRLDSDIPRDPSADASEIERLTAEDVVWAANQIKLDTVYFLTKR